MSSPSLLWGFLPISFSLSFPPPPSNPALLFAFAPLLFLSLSNAPFFSSVHPPSFTLPCFPLVPTPSLLSPYFLTLDFFFSSHPHDRSMTHSWRMWRLLEACPTFVTPSSSTGAGLRRRQMIHLSSENLRVSSKFIPSQKIQPSPCPRDNSISWLLRVPRNAWSVFISSEHLAYSPRTPMAR